MRRAIVEGAGFSTILTVDIIAIILALCKLSSTPTADPHVHWRPYPDLGCPSESVTAFAHTDVEHQLLHPDLPVAVGGLLLSNL
jgi:hypothetical protein